MRIVALLITVAWVAGCSSAPEPIKEMDVPVAGTPEVPATPMVHDAAPTHAPELACTRPSTFAAVQLDADSYRSRHGVGLTQLADVVSTKEMPIEVCMVEGQLEWLVALQCADGSSPFASEPEAHAARSGNVGAGGRCDSIIDVYTVPCPEGAKEVFMDLYMCPE
jgi:hypothetical protein